MKKKKNYIVYTINLNDEVKYVGKTAYFPTRKWQHFNYRGTFKSAIPTDIDLGNITFNKVAVYSDEVEALKEEDRLILEYGTIENGWNTFRSGLECISNRKEYNRKCALKYSREHKEQKKKYQQEHKEAFRKYALKYYYKNKVNKTI